MTQGNPLGVAHAGHPRPAWRLRRAAAGLAGWALRLTLLLLTLALALAGTPLARGAPQPAGPETGSTPQCGALAPVLQPLGPGVWWVPAASGDATAANRGQVSNLLLVAQGQRLWLLGSGPSTAFGRGLACVLQRDLGRAVSDVVSPWARPELVLGVAGLQQAVAHAAPAVAGPAQDRVGPAPAVAAPPVDAARLRPTGRLRHWAHADVAEAMAARCARCVDRLRQRLDDAGDDLAPDPVRVPQQWLHGDAGRLGPFQWWRLRRAGHESITVWRLQRPARADRPGRPLWVAHGLLNGDGPADARDADITVLAASVVRLQALVSADGPAAQLMGEQGPVQGTELVAQHQSYWRELRLQVLAAMDAGLPETAPAPAWPGLPPGWASHPWHALNWQHAWRMLEPEWLGQPR